MTTAVSIPSQQKGGKSTTTHTVKASSSALAVKTFNNAREKLLQVNHWHDICGPHSAHFQLTDNDGQPLEHAAQPGDHIRIDLPAPANRLGHGYDWVIIEAIDDKCSPTGSCSYIAMRVRPSDNPERNTPATAHFYESTATSSFIVERRGNSVRAGVYGRNELPNDETPKLWDKIRNTLISLMAMIGLHKPQWKSLVMGLLRT
jgi:hypothetical protein